MSTTDNNVGSMSLMDLFRQEVQTHCATLAENLLVLERKPADPEALALLMRAAHSLKGAARIMDIVPVVNLTLAMENVFVAGQAGNVTLDVEGIDLLLKGVERLKGVLAVGDDEIHGWLAGQKDEMDKLGDDYASLAAGKEVEKEEPPVQPPEETSSAAQQPKAVSPPEPAEEKKSEVETVSQAGATEPPPSPKVESIPEKGFSVDLSSMSMMDLFRQEAETHCETLTDNLLRLEQDPADADALASLMRAAHSIKGAARVIELNLVVGLAHAMEDVFVAAQDNKLVIDQEHIDALLRGSDVFEAIAGQDDSQLEIWFVEQEQSIRGMEKAFKDMAAGKGFGAMPPVQVAAPEKDFDLSKQPKPSPKESEGKDRVEPTVRKPVPKQDAEPRAVKPKPNAGRKPVVRMAESKKSSSEKAADRSLRVSAEGMNRLMGFAGEVQVESRWLPSFAQKILLLKHRQDDFHRQLSVFSESSGYGESSEVARSSIQNLFAKLDTCRNNVNELLAEAEDHARRSTEISHYLYQEVLANRMRPFIDGVRHFPRMVRDVARELGKKVEFQIIGEETLVDRDIHDKIEAPLNHLVRNAVDHGIETTEERRRAGKSETARITLEARHSAGMLSIQVSDDGRGIDIEKLRQAVITKKMITEEAASQLRETELLEFLFLPNFTTRDAVSEVSGRGVGLDVVHSAVHEVRGLIRTNTTLGSGTTFELQLPLTLSVMRSLLVEISNEVYAFPLVTIDHVLSQREEVKEVEGRQYVSFGQERIGLVSAHQVLGKPDRDVQEHDQDELLILIISDHYNRYGMIVDRFVEIRDLVVQPLDRRLDRVQDISSVAILEDGTPVLIVDTEDMVRSIDSLISGNRLRRIGNEDLMVDRPLKRILVVDDSITVREVERKMLSVRGYEVLTAVDGMDGWNTLRSDNFDLVVTDVDMPRMDGIEFVTLIRQDQRYENLPIIIVSYKDREEDRNRGLEAGADYYLTKGSFQDETLVSTVEELIGPPQKEE